MERAMAVDEAASALGLLRDRDLNFCASSSGEIGVETVGSLDFRRRDIARTGGQIDYRLLSMVVLV